MIESCSYHSVRTIDADGGRMGMRQRHGLSRSSDVAGLGLPRKSIVLMLRNEILVK